MKFNYEFNCHKIIEIINKLNPNIHFSKEFIEKVIKKDQKELKEIKKNLKEEKNAYILNAYKEYEKATREDGWESFIEDVNTLVFFYDLLKKENNTDNLITIISEIYNLESTTPLPKKVTDIYKYLAKKVHKNKNFSIYNLYEQIQDEGMKLYLDELYASALKDNILELKKIIKSNPNVINKNTKR